MNFVRCEQCGAKALIAASQCPKCTHPLSLRDFRGDVVPLAHCHKCDTYYRRSLGGCRWCGTKATGVAIPRRVILAGAAVLVAVAAVGSWQWRAAKARDAASSAEAPSAGELAATSAGDVAVAAPVDSGTLAADSTADSMTDVDADSLANQPASATFQAGGATAASPPAQAPASVSGGAGSAAPSAAGGEGDAARTARAARAATRYSGPWLPGLAREWVNVRASNSPGSEVVGVVTPNTRVQLGELRSGWRRVRSAGVEGWADARYFTSDSTPP